MIKKFDDAKNKIKKASVIAGISALSLIPLKGKAQMQQAQDLEKQKIGIVADTIRYGISVKNESSVDKPIAIEGHGGYVSFYNNDFESDFPDVFYGGTPYNLVAKGTIQKSSENSYTYNTDSLYDKYKGIMEKAFPVPNKTYLYVAPYGAYTSISFYADSKQKSVYFMLIKSDTEEIIFLAAPENNVVYIYTPYDLRSMEYKLTLSRAENIGKINDKRTYYSLNSDGSGFTENIPPNNLIQPKTNIIPDKSISH